MIYITGDTHRDFSRIWNLCRKCNTTTEDIIIILGDAGINYFGDLDNKDRLVKERLSKLPITIFCIHGNHEMRPQNIPSYERIEWHGGQVFQEKKFPNLLFAIDGEIYELDGKRCIVIGGAYSIDKHYRLTHGLHWFADEQPSEEVKRHVEAVLAEQEIDIVLSHTCPKKYEPTEVFLKGIDQSRVDKSTEEWLDTIEESISYKKWYCGHYHTEKRTHKLQFMFKDIDELKV